MASDPAIVRFEDVSVEFGDTLALEHLTFELRPGDHNRGEHGAELADQRQ